MSQGSSLRRNVVVGFTLEAAFGFIAFIVATTAVNACYLVEASSHACVSDANGPLFAVSRGEAFEMLTASLVFWVHGAYATYSLQTDSVSPKRLGLLLGSGMVVTLMATQVAGVWGSLSAMLDYLQCEAPDRLPRSEQDVALVCNGYRPTFSALCVVSSLVFLCCGFATSALYFYGSDFLRLGTEVMGSSYENFVSSRAGQHEEEEEGRAPIAVVGPLPGFFNATTTSAAATAGGARQ